MGDSRILFTTIWDFSSPEDIDYQLGLLPTWRLQSNLISPTSTTQATDSGPYGKGGIFTATQVTRRGSGPSSGNIPTGRKDSTLGCLVVKNRKGKTRLNNLNLGIAKKKCWNNPSAVHCCRHVQHILWIDELNALQTAVSLVVMTQTLSQETSCTSEANISGWFIQRVLAQFAKLATRFPPWRQSQHSCDI